jgi:hypothetical protein
VIWNGSHVSDPHILGQIRTPVSLAITLKRRTSHFFELLIRGAPIAHPYHVASQVILFIVPAKPSFLSQLDDAFAQNHKDRMDWQSGLANGLATERGLRLSEDDRLRRELMQ